MKTQIISIGDELLIGQVINTNASWIGEQLTLAGFEVEKVQVISDNKNAISSMFESLCGNVQLVIITGGLGPTKDDITKTVICDFLSSKLVLNENVVANIQALFLKRGILVSETNRKQAEVPEACRVLQNKNGTAPGLWFEKNGTTYIALPGVPFEMKVLIADQIIPMLIEKYNPPCIVQKTIHIQGIPESHLSDMLETWEESLKQKGFALAYLPHYGVIRLRITGRGSDKEKLMHEIDSFIQSLKAIISDDIFGFDYDSIESVIGEILIEFGKTVGVAESCTGGKIASMITSVPGSSAYFKGSAVTYSNEAKKKLLDVSTENLTNFGAVSQQVVEEMAQGARLLFNTDFGIATTGIAGPDGGTPDKPVGTVWIAIATTSAVISKKFTMGNLRDVNIARTAVTALGMLRKVMLNLP
jgi:nicotinamide-nucleotide amidase